MNIQSLFKTQEESDFFNSLIKQSGIVAIPNTNPIGFQGSIEDLKKFYDLVISSAFEKT